MAGFRRASWRLGCLDPASCFRSLSLQTKPLRRLIGSHNCRYTDAHLVQLNFVRHRRSLGIGLPEVRSLRSFQVSPESACEEINQLIDKQIGRIHQQIEKFRLLEQQLRALRVTCRASQETSECGIMRNLAKAAEGEGCPCHSPEHAE